MPPLNDIAELQRARAELVRLGSVIDNHALPAAPRLRAASAAAQISVQVCDLAISKLGQRQPVQEDTDLV